MFLRNKKLFEHNKLASNLRSISNYLHIKKDSNTGIATIVLQKAKVNSLDVKFLKEVKSCFINLDEDDEIKGVLMKTKFHGKVFSAGLDINGLQNASTKDLRSLWSSVQDWCLSMFRFSKPLVACLNGHAVAGGCAFPLLADYRVGFPNIKIGLTEAQMGIPVEMLNLLQFHCSNSKRFAEYSLLTGPVHSADIAFKYGMLDEIVPLEQVEKASKRKLIELTNVPLLAYSQTKFLMRRQIIRRIEDTKEEGINNFVKTVQSDVVQNIVRTKLNLLDKKLNV